MSKLFCPNLGFIFCVGNFPTAIGAFGTKLLSAKTSRDDSFDCFTG